MAFPGKVKAAALAAFLGESPRNSVEIHNPPSQSVTVLPECHVTQPLIFAFANEKPHLPPRAALMHGE
jgi:hypothetical protein